MVSAILLAAGESRRMGQSKLLLSFGGSTILEHALDNLLKSRVDEVIVVIGNQADEMRKRIASRPVKVITNPDFRQGMATSVTRGLNLVNPKSSAIMLVLADQPLIDSQTINKLIDAFASHDRGIVIPVYRGKRGHPIIFASKYREALLQLKGDVGGRELVGQHLGDILEVPVDSPGVALDIDTPDDYRSLDSP
ncbi:MAG: molybdenum cofactor cytidylyltransferase [Chloroflexota bacterium]|nr:molybdenum cofactor cytidylyltransferase [Chloroflexota bacterium]